MTKKAYGRKKNNNNIYTDLFNDYKKKEIKLNELKYRFNKSEEKICTFSPRINHSNNKIKNKMYKNNEKNQSFENKIKNPLYGYSYKRTNKSFKDLLYNDIDDIIKYETIDNENNNNIILNFLNQSRIKNITKNDLYNIKYMKNNNFNNLNNSKNYFSLNTSKYSDFNTINHSNNLLRDLSGDRSNKVKKNYYTNIMNKKKCNIINDNKEIINFFEPIIRNTYDNKYNTINATERKSINIFNNKKTFNEPSSKNIINNKLKFKNSIKSNRNNEYNIYSGLNQKYKHNEESKENNFYYSFRKEKVKYNSFNNTSKKKNKNIIPHNVKRTNKNKKNKIPISSRDNTNSKKIINKIYLNNYNNKICSQKKSEHDYNINNTANKQKNKISFLDMTSKKESTRQLSNTNYTINDTKIHTTSNGSLINPITIKSKKELNTSYKKSPKVLTYSTNNKKNGTPLMINKYEIVNECKMNLEKKSDFKGRGIGPQIKNEKSMTLQSLSDSKMLELAEHYINNGEDSFEVVDLKYLEFKKNLKKNKESKDITFG